MIDYPRTIGLIFDALANIETDRERGVSCIMAGAMLAIRAGADADLFMEMARRAYEHSRLLSFDKDPA